MTYDETTGLTLNLGPSSYPGQIIKVRYNLSTYNTNNELVYFSNTGVISFMNIPCDDEFNESFNCQLESDDCNLICNSHLLGTLPEGGCIHIGYFSLSNDLNANASATSISGWYPKAGFVDLGNENPNTCLNLERALITNFDDDNYIRLRKYNDNNADLILSKFYSTTQSQKKYIISLFATPSGHGANGSTIYSTNFGLTNFETFNNSIFPVPLIGQSYFGIPEGQIIRDETFSGNLDIWQQHIVSFEADNQYEALYIKGGITFDEVELIEDKMLEENYQLSYTEVCGDDLTIGISLCTINSMVYQWWDVTDTANEIQLTNGTTDLVSDDNTTPQGNGSELLITNVNSTNIYELRRTFSPITDMEGNTLPIVENTIAVTLIQINVDCEETNSNWPLVLMHNSFSEELTDYTLTTDSNDNVFIAVKKNYSLVISDQLNNMLDTTTINDINNANSFILKFDHNGNYLDYFVFAINGGSINPYRLECDQNDNIYIFDSRIHKLSNDLDLLFEFDDSAQFGVMKSQIDETNNVLISYRYQNSNPKIQLFSLVDGSLVVEYIFNISNYNPPYNSFNISTIIDGGNGDFFISGRIGTEETLTFNNSQYSGSIYNHFLAKINYDGNTFNEEEILTDYVPYPRQITYSEYQNNLYFKYFSSISVYNTNLTLLSDNYFNFDNGHDSRPNRILFDDITNSILITEDTHFEQTSLIRSFEYTSGTYNDENWDFTLSLDEIERTNITKIEQGKLNQNHIYILGQYASSDGIDDFLPWANNNSLFITRIINYGDHAETGRVSNTEEVDTNTLPNKDIIYPNPFTNKFTIDLSNNKKGMYYISVHTSYGEKIINSTIDTNQKDKLEISIPSKYLPGIYALRITDNKGITETYKLIKE